MKHFRHQFAGTSPKNSNQFELVGLVARTKLKSVRLVAKMASSHDGTCHVWLFVVHLGSNLIVDSWQSVISLGVKQIQTKCKGWCEWKGVESQSHARSLRKILQVAMAGRWMNVLSWLLTDLLTQNNDQETWTDLSSTKWGWQPKSRPIQLSSEALFYCYSY